MTSCLQFVDGITANPVVRLDLDDGVFWAVDAETTFPPPPLRRSTTSTLLTDGEQISASAYGNRELRLVLTLLSEDGDTDATYEQKLVRELDKVTNILRYTPPGASTPLFFRTFRAAPDAVQWDELQRKCNVTIPAEPFGLGPRVDVGSTLVSQNPAAGSFGCFLDVTGVKGDVETPLLLTYDGLVDNGSAYFAASLAAGVRTGSSPYPTLFRQAESLTLGTDTTAVADATFSGGSKARISFASSNSLFVPRLTGVFPTATLPAGAENRGTYRVFIRCRSVTALQTYTIKLDTGTTVTQEINAYPTIIDLGILTVQNVSPTAPGYDSTPFGLTWLPTVNLYASRATASDQLDIDYILLIPADYRYGSWDSAVGTASNDLIVIDGPNDQIYSSATALFTTPRLSRLQPPSREGSLPNVRPGDNRVYIYQTYPADGSGVGSRITDTLNVAAYYWPRYLYARPVAT